jgi:ubiquinone/menaquinone biosynthesis C-methylase UbiE
MAALGSRSNEDSVSRFSETADIETSSEEYARRFSGRAGEYFLETQSQVTLDLLKPRSRATVLDVGGGHAQLAVPLVERGCRVVVTGSADICRKRLDRFLAPESFEYLTCDMLELPFEKDSFDAVIAFRLLPHVERWPELLSEMCRVSKGAVLFDYPDSRSFNILYTLFFRAKKALETNTRPFRIFQRRELVEVLEQNGYGKVILRPQFFLPMVVHRLVGSARFSRVLEFAFRALGLTRLFGSPIILKATRGTERQ